MAYDFYHRIEKPVDSVAEWVKRKFVTFDFKAEESDRIIKGLAVKMKDHLPGCLSAEYATAEDIRVSDPVLASPEFLRYCKGGRIVRARANSRCGCVEADIRYSHPDSIEEESFDGCISVRLQLSPHEHGSCELTAPGKSGQDCFDLLAGMMRQYSYQRCMDGFVYNQDRSV